MLSTKIPAPHFAQVTHICSCFKTQQLKYEPQQNEEIRQDISCFIIQMSEQSYH